VSSRPTDFFNIFWMPGFTTVDAALLYRRAHAEYSVNVTNLADNKHYFISAIDDTQVYPGPPINVTGTIRFRF
jgi:iron complex outermembrane receptor protein